MLRVSRWGDLASRPGWPRRLNRSVAFSAGSAYGWFGPQGSIKAWQGMARLHRQQRLAVAYLQQVEALPCVFLKRRFLVG